MSPGLVRPVVVALQAVLIACVVLWVADAPGRLNLALFTEQFLATVLGLTLALVYFGSTPAGGPAKPVPLHDVVAGLAGLAACLYVAFRYPALIHELVHRPVDGVMVASVIVLLVLEATRRTAGLALTIVILVLCGYALLGFLLPGVFASRKVELTRLAVYLGIDTNALLGQSLQVAVVIVLPFILMGQILTRCGGGEYFTDLAMAAMGRYRGGSAKIAVVGSGLFGMISGSAVANVAGVGIVTIPLMKRSGFPPHTSAAIEAVGSTGGQLMPPVMGAAAFLVAEYLQVPYREVMIAAFLPALLYYAALFIQVDLEAAKRGIAGAPLDRLPAVLTVLARGWHFPIPFAALIGGLVWWNLRPEIAALLATVLLIVLGMTFGYGGKRLGAREAVSGVVSTGGSVLDIIVVTAAAGLVIGVLNLTGVAFGLTLQLLAASGNNILVLLVVAALVAIVLGMGMPTVGVYVIMATLAAPALVQAGIAPMQAHLFVMYFGMLSMVTPPVAFAAFAAANIAEADFWRTGWTSVRIGWSAYLIPFLFALSPQLILRGEPLQVAISAATALLGVYLGSVAVVGHLRVAVAPPLRLAYGVLALMLLAPVDLFAGAPIANLVGVAGAAAAIAFELWRGRAARKPAEKPAMSRNA
ncbi:MAG: C4-dicarboxylate ABC transporter permease [Bradyrhizobiaceae bacterium]|nr:MAG: C4-dicarboxylate ABC transporter permease [Bradyrhizobiaceae bacterium]